MLQNLPNPPKAKQVPKALTIHGDVRQDPYFWLNNPEDPAVIDYLNQENSYTENVLKPTEALQNELFEEMKGRIKEDDSSVPYFLNGYWYITRFETGKKLNLILNRDPKKLPVFVIANSTAEINGVSLILRIFGWLLVVVLVIGYYFYSYQDESHGMGWRFMSFGHPLLVCALVFIFYRYLLKFILSKLTGINQDSVLIKFKIDE